MSMNQEVMRFIEENDVKFIRLAFCDLFGAQKNLSVMPSELERAMTQGISFDANAMRGFHGRKRSDLFLVPDAGTLAVLPWRPQQGRVVRFVCDIVEPGGAAFACNTRGILRAAVERARRMGLDIRMGAECEFYLFRTDAEGEPTTIPFDRGGYLDISPADKGENVRREICLCLEDMGLRPEKSHHEQGPGQNEIAFRHADAVQNADDVLTLKTVVKSVAARNGLHASFLPKPLADAHGSGLHINVSVHRAGENAFAPGSGCADVGRAFLAGVLQRAAECSLFLNPLHSSYDRLGAFEAPRRVAWSRENRSTLVRLPAADDDWARMELRSPDPAANPYIAFALLIHAGCDGIERGDRLPDAADANLFDAAIDERFEALPDDLARAVALGEASDFVRTALGDDVVDRTLAVQREEVGRAPSAEERIAYDIKRHFLTV